MSRSAGVVILNSCDREHGSERVGEVKAATTTTALVRERSSERLHDEVQKGGSCCLHGCSVWKSLASVLVGGK